jgi:hypothetical protein
MYYNLLVHLQGGGGALNNTGGGEIEAQYFQTITVSLLSEMLGGCSIISEKKGRVNVSYYRKFSLQKKKKELVREKQRERSYN